MGSATAYQMVQSQVSFCFTFGWSCRATTNIRIIGQGPAVLAVGPGLKFFLSPERLFETGH